MKKIRLGVDLKVKFDLEPVMNVSFISLIDDSCFGCFLAFNIIQKHFRMVGNLHFMLLDFPGCLANY